MNSNISAPDIRERKHSENRIVMVTAYDHPSARLAQQAGVDIILVGDSLGMVVLGYPDTLQVTMADMIHHCRAVSRGADRPLRVGDLPFMSYHVSREQAVQNAGRLIQDGGMDAVKLEGGIRMIDRVEAIIQTGIPVMGHIGLTPQSVKAFGGFKTQGKTLQAARELLADATALENVGVFALVLEGIPAELAEVITQRVSIPTIGISAGPSCDGQVLVYHDLLGIPEPAPYRFVQTFAHAGQEMGEGLSRFVQAVRAGEFPSREHAVHLSDSVNAALKRMGGKHTCG